MYQHDTVGASPANFPAYRHSPIGQAAAFPMTPWAGYHIVGQTPAPAAVTPSLTDKLKTWGNTESLGLANKWWAGIGIAGAGFLAYEAGVFGKKKRR